MHIPLGSILGVLIALPAFVTSSAIPHYFDKNPSTRHKISVDLIGKELGAQLSPQTVIFDPSDSGWENVTYRWNTIATPDVEIAVQVGKESDIAKVVKYCNRNSLNFLAINRAHGSDKNIGRFKGVQIDLKQLTGIKIQRDKKSALFEGGVYGGNVIRELWERGFATTTGSNECVGLMGAGLGGGHGRLAGLYGLIIDNIVHLNVVLADGTTIGVNRTSHADLFWGMRGAGHNFGIVSSVRMKIYPARSPTWHWHNYWWTGDKLETVLEALNDIHRDGRTPPEWGSGFLQISFNQSISETEGSLRLATAYNGPAKDAEAILAALNRIPTVYQDKGDVPYPQINGPQFTDFASCIPGSYAVTTALLRSYNVTAQRKLYDHFNRKAAENPELARTAQLYLEAYAVKGMRVVNPASTAYPHRDQNHLAFFLTGVPDGSNLTDAAEQWAKESWDILVEGELPSAPRIYASYGTGNPHETLESIYGYESWRLERLRGLKARYDPLNRFKYFVPIISA